MTIRFGGGQPHFRGGQARYRRAGGNGAKVLLDELLGLGAIEVAGDGEDGVSRGVVGAEKPLHVLDGSRGEILHGTDHLVEVRVVGRVERLQQHLLHEASGPVLRPLPALVLHHVPLVVERLLEAGAVQQKAHPIALQPEGQLELIGGDDLEVVGAILRSRAVDVGGAGLLQVLEVLVLADVLRALKHHVLEQVGESRSSRNLVASADFVPDVDDDLGHPMVLVQDHLEAIRQYVFLERQPRQVGRGGLGGSADAGASCAGAAAIAGPATARPGTAPATMAMSTATGRNMPDV